MNEVPSFSVLLPVYFGDDPRHLDSAFRSVVDQQSLRPNQVVLVRDGPVPAELTSVISRLARSTLTEVTLVLLEENRGLAGALTEGLRECRFDVVARMDADDLSREDRFELQIPLMRDFDLVGSALHEFSIESSGEIRILGKRTPPLTHDEIADYVAFHDPFNHPTVVLRRSAVERAGGYEPLGTMEDYWLFARMVHGGARTMNLPDALVRYRVDAGAYARRGGRAALASELALQRAFRRVGITSRAQYARNLLLRMSYRLIPSDVRRILYRRLVAQGFRQI